MAQSTEAYVLTSKSLWSMEKNQENTFCVDCVQQKHNPVYIFVYMYVLCICMFKCDPLLFPLPGFVTAKILHGFCFLHLFPRVNLSRAKKT